MPRLLEETANFAIIQECWRRTAGPPDAQRLEQAVHTKCQWRIGFVSRSRENLRATSKLCILRFYVLASAYTKSRACFVVMNFSFFKSQVPKLLLPTCMLWLFFRVKTQSPRLNLPLLVLVVSSCPGAQTCQFHQNLNLRNHRSQSSRISMKE